MTTTAIKEQLAVLTDGLLYISESEGKFDIIDAGPAAGREIPQAFATVSGLNVADFTASDVALFFNKVIDHADPADDFMMQQARRYAALQQFLTENLQDVRLLRGGKPQVHIFMYGTTLGGTILAIHTTAIET